MKLCDRDEEQIVTCQAQNSTPLASLAAFAHTVAMGFYYDSGQPSPDDDKGGGFRETIAIIWVVFRVLAMPLGVLLGIVLALFGLFWLFTITPFLGVGVIGLGIAALIIRGIWEARHPPELR